MKNTPTNLHDLDHQSDGQQYNTTTTRPLPLIDIYKLYYPDPDFGFDPYWDIYIYNQHNLHFHSNYTKTTTERESDSSEIDRNLNTNLS